MFCSTIMLSIKVAFHQCQLLYTISGFTIVPYVIPTSLFHVYHTVCTDSMKMASMAQDHPWIVL